MLNLLKKLIGTKNIDGYIIPKNDEFFSEYSFPNRLKLISNFSGSAGLAIILKDKNFLFVVRTGSKENFYKGSLIQQIDINNLSEFKVIENKNMRWLDRIFLIKNFGEFPKFGSLTEINDDLDFTFDGLNMKLIK